MVGAVREPELFQFDICQYGMEYMVGPGLQRICGRPARRGVLLDSLVVFLDAPPFFVDRHESDTVKAKVIGYQIPFPRGAVLVRKDLPYRKDLDVKTLQVDLHRGIAGDRFAYSLPLPVVPFLSLIHISEPTRPY